MGCCLTLMSEKTDENRKNSSNRTIQRRERVYEWNTRPPSYFSSDNEQWIY